MMNTADANMLKMSMAATTSPSNDAQRELRRRGRSLSLRLTSMIVSKMRILLPLIKRTRFDVR